MSDHTGIEWTDSTWNPIAGCSIISPGCTHCYAMKMAARIEAMGKVPHYKGLTQPSKAGAVWTGKVVMAPDNILLQPLRWKRPRKIFVNSMADLFHKDVPDAWIDRVFAAMALCPQHTFQVLTKRSGRMKAYLSNDDLHNRLSDALGCMLDGEWIWKEGKRFRPRIEKAIAACFGFEIDDEMEEVQVDDLLPLPNVWLGVSVEDQERANERIPDLLATPAAQRFISAEPLLGPVDLRAIISRDGVLGPFVPFNALRNQSWIDGRSLPRIDWVIAGGESGPGARPSHPDWFRALRDQCAGAGVAFFFKQWGEYRPRRETGVSVIETTTSDVYWPDGSVGPGHARDKGGPGGNLDRVGKGAAGALLDGVLHRAMPGRLAA